MRPIQSLAAALVGLTTLSAVAAQKPFIVDHDRVRTRVAYFVQSDSGLKAPQISIDCGIVPWKDEYLDQAEGMADGERWRLGRDFWSTLDTNTPVTMGGVEIPAGYYYLALEKDGGTWNLAVMETDAIRSNQVDAFQVKEKTTGGILVPLEEVDADSDSKMLALAIHPTGDETPNSTRFQLDFGPMHLATTIEMPAGSGRPFTMVEARRGIRMGTFGGGKVVNVAIEHSKPAWNDSRVQLLGQLQPGMRWRLGSNFWTTLDTHTAVDIAGQKIDPGHYYLTLEKQEAGWHLVVMDAAETRKGVFDAFQANPGQGGTSPVTGGTEIPLETSTNDTPVKELTVGFEPAEDGAVMVISWGPHRMSAPIKML